MITLDIPETTLFQYYLSQIHVPLRRSLRHGIGLGKRKRIDEPFHVCKTLTPIFSTFDPYIKLRFFESSFRNRESSFHETHGIHLHHQPLAKYKRILATIPNKYII